jgi:long-chain acyl-CoA synthetase
MQKDIYNNLQQYDGREFVFDSISDTSFTGRDIWEKALGIGNFLFSRGIQKGSKVAVVLNNSVTTITIYLANFFMGAVTIPLNPNFHRNDFEYIWNKSAPDIILTTTETIHRLQDSDIVTRFQLVDVEENQWARLASPGFQFQLPEIHWEDPIAILFTSGTTGRPKGVVMKYGAVLDNLKQYGTDMQFDETTRFMQVVPLFHAHGWLYSSIVPALFNSSLVLNPPFNASLCSEFWDIAARYQANVLVSVPSMLVSLLEMRERYQEIPERVLKYIICGSAFLHPDVKQEFERSFKTVIYEFYGSTETVYIAYHSPSGEFKAGTVGRIFPRQCRIKIAEDGEILVNTRYIFKEYYEEEELTRAAFAGEWYKTGDLGIIDEAGYVRLTGRKKDIINKGGFKVSPQEITNALLRLEAVRDAYTIGVPDPMYGEEIYSFVVVDQQSDLTEQDLLKYCRKVLNPMICPKKVKFIAEIPKNPSGKADKFKLSECIR